MVGNIDATIIAQRPKMLPHIPKMRENVANALGIDIERVNIKATTEEGLGFTGSGEGISSQAICLLEEMKDFSVSYEETPCSGCKGCKRETEEQNETNSRCVAVNDIGCVRYL